MYKVKNDYESDIFDLNMLHVHEYKKNKITGAEIILTITPLVLAAGVFLSAVIPELSFFAECQNIPGGDVCSISMK